MCCWAKGMPTMVTAISRANTRWTIATSTPPNTHHRTFIRMGRSPLAEPTVLTCRPNGARLRPASLNNWTPNGMPTMVRHSTSPPIM